MKPVVPFAIKINNEFYCVRSLSSFKNPDDRTKLNLEMVEFLFSAYSRYGLLPISELVQFIEKNHLIYYLECKKHQSTFQILETPNVSLKDY